MGKGDKRYVVFEGRNPGVYDNWEDAQEQVIHYSNSKHKSYPTMEEAQRVEDQYRKSHSGNQEVGKGYAVFAGRTPGVYPTWEDAEKQVKRFSHSSHKSYESVEVANRAFADHLLNPHYGNQGSSSSIGRESSSSK